MESLKCSIKHREGRKRRKKKGQEQMDFNPIISIITINLSRLKTLAKRHKKCQMGRSKHTQPYAISKKPPLNIKTQIR